MNPIQDLEVGIIVIIAPISYEEAEHQYDK